MPAPLGPVPEELHEFARAVNADYGDLDRWMGYYHPDFPSEFGDKAANRLRMQAQIMPAVRELHLRILAARVDGDRAEVHAEFRSAMGTAPWRGTLARHEGCWVWYRKH